MRKENSLLDEHLTDDEQLNRKDPLLFTRPIGLLLSMGIVGTISSLVRPYANYHGIHYEAIISLILTIGVSIYLSLYFDNRRHYHQYRLLYIINTLVIWIGYSLGLWLAADNFLTESLVINGLVAIIIAITGLLKLRPKNLS